METSLGNSIRKSLPHVFGFLLAFLLFWWISPRNQNGELAQLTPWQAVGGCGAGGSGGGAADGIQWIGQGVTGGRVEFQNIFKLNVGQNFQGFSMSPRFSYKPTWNTTLRITTPFVSNQAEVQYRSNQSPHNRTTGGLGDISIDGLFNFGPSAEYGLSIGLTLPSAQYDIVRGPDAAREFLPGSLQKGDGLYNLSVGLTGLKDVSRGIWLWNVAWSFPFNSRFMTGKNEFMDSWLVAYRGQNSRRFYYDWKFYGENDLGDFSPQALSAGLYYGYRGRPGQVHSFGLSFRAPLGVAWIRNEQVGVYDPRPDPDHLAWSTSLVYGLEFIRNDFPLFMAFSLPLQDRANAPGADEYDPTPMQAWNRPDWGNFGEQWTAAVGFKTTFW